MTCAIDRDPMAHQWRNRSAPLLNWRLREKANGAGASISFFPTARQRRNVARGREPEGSSQSVLANREFYK